MTLRWRLFLTTLVVAIHLVVVLVFGYQILARRGTDELHAALIRARFEGRAAESCTPEVAQRMRLPVRPGGPFADHSVKNAVVVYFLDAQGRGAAEAPRVPREMLDAIARGAEHVGSDERVDGEPVRSLLVPLRHAGACALALVVGPRSVGLLPPLPMVVIPVGMALLAVLIGVGPIVRRTRSLTAAVRRLRVDSQHPLPADAGRDEIGDLFRAFVDATQATAARERDLREFVENVSHDLATPLSVLQAHLSTLAKSGDSEVVRQAMNEAHYLAGLLGSLSVTAKFEAGATVDTEVDLAELTSRVVDRHRALAARLGVSLDCAVPDGQVVVRGDLTFVEQALSNLVANALRHNERGGHAAVVLDVVRDAFSLRVLDDGPGLSEAERESVLRRGVRGDRARSRDPDGHGLGLSIVARVAAIHRWTFSLEPHEPRGLVAELRGVRVEAAALHMG